MSMCDDRNSNRANIDLTGNLAGYILFEKQNIDSPAAHPRFMRDFGFF
jgi:hypothetical protein